MSANPAIMVVDDSPLNLEILGEVLSGRYRVYCASSGEEALSVAASNPHLDCVLMDILMPGMDGYETCKRLKSMPELVDVPVIFVSSLDETLNKVKGFESGGVDYVTKPIEPEEVLARVRTHVRLRTVQREYLAAKIRADQAVAAKNHFLACVSHELRTPLQVILGTAELFQANALGSLSEDQARFIGRIEQSGQHLLGLVNDVLDITQIDADAFNPDIKVFGLSELVPPVLAMMDSHFLRKRITVRAVLDDALPSLEGDLRKCRQVLLNLLSNAVKYTPEAGCIDVAAERGDRGFVKISVSDSGPGVPEAYRDNLFTDYFQVDKLRDGNLGGKGLGLALSRRLVQLHGGQMGVVPGPGGAGSVFWFTLPAAEPASIVEEQLPVAAISASLDSLRHKRVLVVEEDHGAAITMKNMLETAGMVVALAHSANDACQMEDEGPFDLVLTELHMRGVNGPAVVEMLRKQFFPGDIPILVATSHVDRETVRLCRASGARDVLLKPVARDSMLPRLAMLFADNRVAT